MRIFSRSSSWLMPLALLSVVCAAPAMANPNHLGVKVKEITFTDTSTPSFNAPCPLLPGNPIFDKVDQGTVEGKLQGTIIACLKFSPGLFPQADGFFEIATEDVIWRGTFRAFTTPNLAGDNFLATGEYFGDGTDGSRLRGRFDQFQLADPATGTPDRFLDTAIIIKPLD